MLKIFNEQRGQTTFLEGPFGKQRLNLDFNLSSNTKLTNSFKIDVVDNDNNSLFQKEYTKLVDNIQIPLNIKNYPIKMQLKYDDGDYVPYPYEVSFIGYPYTLWDGPLGQQ